MNDQNNLRLTSRIILKPRRLVLLASVAALGFAAIAVGPGRNLSLNLPSWTTAAHAAETGPNTAGFADLVAKVKPAVISVRVKIDGDQDSALIQHENERMDSDEGAPSQGAPFEQFF